MADGQVPGDTYEPPRIDERAAIALPLVAGPAASPVTFSAAFRSHPDVARYEPPAIESRAPIEVPLVGALSVRLSAAFRPYADVARYEPPAIESRAPIEVPL